MIELPTQDTPVAVAAETYARLGLMPIPVHGIRDGRCACGKLKCPSPGKHPVGDEWQKRATLDLDHVRDAFRGHRGNIGIYLGNRFVLIDADGDEGIASALALGEFPPTLEAVSGSGKGRHWIFRLADDQDPHAITDRSKKVGPGLDVKIRGQFVAPPSLHKSGGRYQWVNPVAPAILPGWLYDRIKRPEAAAPVAPAAVPTSNMFERVQAWVRNTPPAIAGQGGHDATFAVANKIAAHKSLSQAEMWAILVEFNGRCEPPWSETELRHKLDSAIRDGRGTPLEDRPRPAAPPAPAAAAAATDDWRLDVFDGGKLKWSKTKEGAEVLKRIPANAEAILEHHSAWRGRLRFDQFNQAILVNGPPWAPNETRVWNDQDTTRLQTWLARAVDPLDIGVNDLDRVVRVVAELQTFHPVKDWMQTLEWDGKPRLTRWLTAYLGAEENDYTRAVGRWWVISAVARAFSPGCKVDHVLILEGPQGLRKSSALCALASPEWFSDTPLDIGSKDAFIALQGKLIVEMAELDSLNRAADAERAKAFFTSAVDRYRPPYGRREVAIPRSCVFAGTTNRGEYLKDDTGNRRFWPVVCTKIDLPGIEEARDQIWAEAVAEYQMDKPWYPVTAEEHAVCKIEQRERHVPDAWAEPISDWLHSTNKSQVSVQQVLQGALHITTDKWDRGSQMRVSSVLRTLGFERRMDRRFNGQVTRYYERPEAQMSLVEAAE